MNRDLGRGLLAEFTGTALLLAAVVGSGIMAVRLTPDPALALLANAIATGAVLAAAIAAFGPVSGAHFNPAVTITARLLGLVDTTRATTYVIAQVVGGVVGVVVANAMFELPLVSVAATVRSGPHLWLSESVATLGLVTVIFSLVRSGRTGMVAAAVGAYVTGAYFFTASTGFANPAVTIARTLTDTFTGIAPGSVPPFLAAQLVGMALATLLVLTVHPADQLD